jgi:Na+-transporting methylmalonyl-CoA/oxaloacetate decarboxylase gamma subunit
MMSLIQQGLLITAIGMGLVFGVIIFLWGLMALMMRLTSRAESMTEDHIPSISSAEPLLPESHSAERRRRVTAAAIAVRLTLDAEKSKISRDDVQEFGQLSPWQAHHRTRQMEQKRIIK